jgi:hypothetical protein
MRRTISASLLAVAASLAVAGAAAAEPISEPASCSGYLASYANPNNGWIIQNLVRPTAADLGITVGELTRGLAFQHRGSLEACIPE